MLMVIIALVVFLYFSNIFSYSMGIKHGRIVKDGGRPNVNPVEIIKTNKETKLEKIKHDEYAEGLANIMAFGEPIEGVNK